MYWSIKVSHSNLTDSPSSVIRVHGDDLREAASKVLDIYRKCALISYQQDGGPEIPFCHAELRLAMTLQT